MRPNKQSEPLHTTSMKKNYHIGAYGLTLLAGKLFVFFKKKRGPYTGLFDLPGGGVDPFENPEDPNQTLKREIMEEIGVDVHDCEVKYLGYRLHSYNNLIHASYNYSVVIPNDMELMSLDKKELGEMLLVPSSSMPEDTEQFTPLALALLKQYHGVG